ncbi:MAG: hypothetical protein HC771_25185 [Synechococcales cyanobacterium CRU_2_2]|nr:hypothetical protein [Synechococcales cyanobacterium CRU_2_2]
MLRNLDFAILAPIPETYLLAGREAIAAQLDAEIADPSLAFGTNEFEVFGEAQQKRGDKAVSVFIYASEPAETPLNPEITWQAIYKSSSHSRRAATPAKPCVVQPTASAPRMPGQSTGS